MKKNTPSASPRRQRGATLIEILVSLVILMVGMLGLVGLMIQSQRSQLESYQRVQALLLVQDIASRLQANKAVAPCYVLSTPLDLANSTVPSCGSGTTAQKDRVTADLSDWRNLLLGAAELSGTSKVGAVLAAKGCIERDATTGIYQLTVAWQGIAATSAPPAGIGCGKDQFGTDDALRRAVSLTVLL